MPLLHVAGGTYHWSCPVPLLRAAGGTWRSLGLLSVLGFYSPSRCLVPLHRAVGETWRILQQMMTTMSAQWCNFIVVFMMST